MSSTATKSPASLQGLEQVFSKYTPLRKGAATYQMPSFALEMVLRTYLRYSHAREYSHGKQIVDLLQNVVDQDLMQFDIYFSENEALNVAAGTYFSGMKQLSKTSTLIPKVIQEKWEANSQLKEQFADINNLTTTNNIMLWALDKGRKLYPDIDQYLLKLKPFTKHGEDAPWNRDHIRSLPLAEAKFSAMGFNPDETMAKNSEIASKRPKIKTPSNGVIQKAVRIFRQEGIKSFVIKGIHYGFSRISRK